MDQSGIYLALQSVQKRNTTVVLDQFSAVWEGQEGSWHTYRQLYKAEERRMTKWIFLSPDISLTNSDVVTQPPPPLSGDPDALAKAFTEHYYPTFDNNRGDLASLYQDDSMLTFDGHKYHGVHKIMARLTTFPFDRCSHQITNYDWQPCPATGGLFIVVTGKLQIAGQTQVHQFTEMFQLVPLRREGIYVLNDIFRLISA